MVLDVFSRKVAGWAMLRHLETETGDQRSR